MTTNVDDKKDFQRIEKALNYVAMNFRQQPSLADIADSVHLSEFHFQRLFTRWAGVSPKQFLQYLTVQYAQECLLSGNSVLDTAYETGLAAPARLGELFVRLEAMTPAEFRRAGKGLDVAYGYHPSPFGECLIAVTARGITGLQFCQPNQQESTLADLKARLPAATYRQDQKVTANIVKQIFTADNVRQKDLTLSLLVAGTPFQVKVWEALLKIPIGCKVSYQQLAVSSGCPAAVRAIGTAVGRNPVAVLIPCHRVIRTDGLPGGYRWGLGRKLALQGKETQSMVGHQANLPCVSNSPE